MRTSQVALQWGERARTADSLRKSGPEPYSVTAGSQFENAERESVRGVVGSICPTVTVSLTIIPGKRPDTPALR